MPTFVADEVVTAAKLNNATLRDGVAYSPASNITLGSGSRVARYVELGSELVLVHYRFTFGSGSAMPSDPTVALPFAAHADYTTLENWVGQATIRDASAGRFAGVVTINGSNFSIRALTVSGSNIVHTTISSTVPMTWATGDILAFEAIYEKA